MPFGHSSIDRGDAGLSFSGRRPVEVALNDEVLAAVEGWRQAHGMTNQSEALGELILLGLMSEVGRIYRMATSIRNAASGDPDGTIADSHPSCFHPSGT